MDLALDLFLYLMLPSAVASSAVMLVANYCLTGRARDGGAPLSCVAGLLAGNAILQFLPIVPDGFGWPALLAVVTGTSLLALATAWISHPMARWSVLMIGLALLAPAVLPSNLHTPVWFSGLIALTWLTTFVLDRALLRETGWILPVAWAVVVCGGATALVMVAHSALFAHVAVLLATSLVGAGLFTGKSLQSRRLLAALMALSMNGLMIAGFDSTFSDVPWYSFALVAIAPLLWSVLLVPQADRWPRWAQLTLSWLLLLVPVTVAVATAIAAEGLGSDY